MSVSKFSPASSCPLGIPDADLQHVLRVVGPHWQGLRGRRVLLTGGTGFIGKWLVAAFLAANREFKLGSQLLVLSRDPQAFVRAFPRMEEAEGISWVRGDVRSVDIGQLAESELCIHAATDVVAAASPSETLETCIGGTRRILEAISRGSGIRRMLLLSSGAVYGRTPPALAQIPEDWMGAPDPLSLASAYGEGKRVSELLCMAAAAERPGLEVSIARCFAFVGPHLPLDKHFAIGNFIEAALRGGDILVKGDGTPLRSYLYAADLAAWLWTMLVVAPSGRAYNVGGAESISIGDLARRVNAVIGGAGVVRIAERPAPGAVAQAYVPSVARIAEELALVPSISLDESIRRTVDWAHQHTPLLS